MKIFISYSRKDAGDFAEAISKYLISLRYDIFTDIGSISAGDVWNTAIESNISNCDIFVVIVTYGALYSPHVDKEVLQAQREKKRIIPCLHRTLRHGEMKWGLNKIQGVEFDDKFELTRNLYSKILQNKNAVNDRSDYQSTQAVTSNRNNLDPRPQTSPIQPQPEVSNDSSTHPSSEEDLKEIQVSHEVEAREPKVEHSISHKNEEQAYLEGEFIKKSQSEATRITDPAKSSSPMGNRDKTQLGKGNTTIQKGRMKNLLLLSIFGSAGIAGIIIAVFFFANNNTPNPPQGICGTQLPGVTLFGSWRWAGTFHGTPQTGLFTFNNNCTYSDIARAGATTFPTDKGNFFVSVSPASINFTNNSGSKHQFLITNISENSFHASSPANSAKLDFTKIP